MSGNAPKYMEIYNMLKRDLFSKKYLPGDFLPTEDQLVKIYGASKTTIRHAISLLRDDGLLNVQQGRGSEVIQPVLKTRQNAYQYANAKGISARFSVENPKITITNAIIDRIAADEKVASQLSIATGTFVYRVQRLYLANDTVFAYWISYFRSDLTPDLDKIRNFPASLSDTLKDQYHIQITRAEEAVSAISAGIMEAHFLGVAPETPLLLFQRTAYCEKGILEYSEESIRSDMFRLVLQIEQNASVISALVETE